MNSLETPKTTTTTETETTKNNSNNNIDVYYNLVFRNKTLRSYIFSLVKDNLKRGYNYYQLPLGVVIKAKRYDYLLDKIDRYIQWKQDPSISDAYLELNEKDIDQLVKVSDIIGYDSFMILFNDFRHIFDKHINNRIITSCSDFNVFLYLVSVYPLPTNVFLFSFSISTNIQVFKYVIDIYKDTLPEKWIRTLTAKWFFQKSLEFFKESIEILYRHLSILPKRNLHQTIINTILAEESISEHYIKEYCNIINSLSPSSFLPMDKQLYQYSGIEISNLRQRYKRFEIMYNNSNVFSDTKDCLTTFISLFVTPKTIHKSKDCLDYAIQLLDGKPLDLTFSSIITTLDNFILYGDLEGVKLLYKLCPLSECQPMFTHYYSLEILKFLVEEWGCLKLDSFNPSVFYSLKCGIDCLEYLVGKFPNLGPSIAPHFSEILYKCPPGKLSGLDRIHSLTSMVPKLKCTLSHLFNPNKLDLLKVVFANIGYFDLDMDFKRIPSLFSLENSLSIEFLDFIFSVAPLRQGLYNKNNNSFLYYSSLSDQNQKLLEYCNEHFFKIKPIYYGVQNIASLLMDQKFNTLIHYLYANGFQVKDVCTIFSTLVGKKFKKDNIDHIKYFLVYIFNSKYFKNDIEKRMGILFTILFLSIVKNIYPLIRDYMFSKSIINYDVIEQQQIKCNFNYIVIDDEAIRKVTNNIKILETQDQTFLYNIGFIDEIRNHKKHSVIQDLFDF
ncbi:hypothetical protein CYY_003525 [Polysphondylium violaceum]|uniref:Uncharacterized protein n=1 Tax=Polysphondylium violaceum TaxID=133409 RepID=A0A8J4PZ45_9MYCE|nr:hypothetical protein CYY_003525 [Polysphondylium violaceum]